MRGLESVRFAGEVAVDPRTDDLFLTVIQERKSLATKPNLSENDKNRLDKALKVLANATSYGIFAVMNRKETEKRVKVQCQGLDPEPYQCSVIHPEEPGEFCFPPVASLITGAARLMLALLEHSVSELGGIYAMEDTDSMAIVAAEQGAIIPSKGEAPLLDGLQEARALFWTQVDRIVEKFEALNPYDQE